MIGNRVGRILEAQRRRSGTHGAHSGRALGSSYRDALHGLDFCIIGNLSGRSLYNPTEATRNGKH